MPTEIEAYGYESLRTFAQNNWNHVAVVDDGGTERIRLDVDADAGASWLSGPSSNPLQAELVITGQDLIDEGHSLPITLDSTEAYEVASGGTRVGTDTFNEATMEAASDELTITHDYSLPQ